MAATLDHAQAALAAARGAGLAVERAEVATVASDVLVRLEPGPFAARLTGATRAFATRPPTCAATSSRPDAGARRTWRRRGVRTNGAHLEWLRGFFAQRRRGSRAPRGSEPIACGEAWSLG
ncbi:MAG: hypothetical protein ACXVFM_13705, partial [Solirubrobacteraceae bacterium]